VDAPDWLRLRDDLCDQLGMGARRPRLLATNQVSTPMTWGVINPVILLPDAVLSWPETRRAMVLAHEIAHVRRRDVLFHVLGRTACALHWVNPLAWLAVRRVRVESERACDDRVLLRGSRAASYAESLLQIALQASSRRRMVFPAIGMASRSDLEKRLRAVLDPR
jgi:beta-lactamase regulating signal transducer with metallopeptidase domain